MEVQNLEGMVKGIEILILGGLLGITVNASLAYAVVKYENIRNAREFRKAAEDKYELTK